MIGAIIEYNGKNFITEKEHSEAKACYGCYFLEHEDLCRHIEKESISQHNIDCREGFIFKELDIIKGKKKLLII